MNNDRGIVAGDSTYDQITSGEVPFIINLSVGIYDVTLTITGDSGFQSTDQLKLSLTKDILNDFK